MTRKDDDAMTCPLSIATIIQTQTINTPHTHEFQEQETERMIRISPVPEQDVLSATRRENRIVNNSLPDASKPDNENVDSSQPQRVSCTYESPRDSEGSNGSSNDSHDNNNITQNDELLDILRIKAEYFHMFLGKSWYQLQVMMSKNIILYVRLFFLYISITKKNPRRVTIEVHYHNAS
jgi:hypothetical protein